MHTTESETIAMHEAAQEPKQLWLVDGAAHIDLFNAEPIQYRKQIVAFLDQHLQEDRQETSEK